MCRKGSIILLIYHIQNFWVGKKIILSLGNDKKLALKTSLGRVWVEFGLSLGWVRVEFGLSSSCVWVKFEYHYIFFFSDSELGCSTHTNKICRAEWITCTYNYWLIQKVTHTAVYILLLKHMARKCQVFAKINKFWLTWLAALWARIE